MVSYLRGLLSEAERKNGWTLAEAAGDDGPQGMQRLLNHYLWDADALRDDVRDAVVEHLGDPDRGVLILDETGFLKKGIKSAGVARQYSGTAGRIENSQIGVFLAYGSDRGRALIDRELYLPKDWISDRERCRAAGIGGDVEFATKPDMGLRMLQRAVESGIPFGWVTADEVYGQTSRIRMWLEQRRISYVVAVDSRQAITGDAGTSRADALAVLARVDDVEGSRLASGLDDAFALVAGRFFRREVRVRARACVAGMLSGLERKTGWSLAEHAGEAYPGRDAAAVHGGPVGRGRWSATTSAATWSPRSATRTGC